PAVLGHGHLDELAGTSAFGDLRRHERDRLVGARRARRQDLAPGPDHGDTSSSPSSTGPGATILRWISCRDRGLAPSVRSASIPCTAARAPGSVVTQGTLAAAAAVRMK